MCSRRTSICVAGARGVWLNGWWSPVRGATPYKPARAPAMPEPARLSVAPRAAPAMRIASLLASGTEMVCALGLRERLVGISHECDYPPEALDMPRLSRARFDPTGRSSGEIDAAVCRAMEQYGNLYLVDPDLIAAVRPDLIP